MSEFTTFSAADLEARFEYLAAKRKHFVTVICDGYDNGTPFDLEFDAVCDEVSTRRLAAADAAFASEWTPETFAARRAAWNTAVVKLPTSKKGLKMTDVRDLEYQLGFTVENLKRAKTLLGA